MNMKIRFHPSTMHSAETSPFQRSLKHLHKFYTPINELHSLISIILFSKLLCPHSVLCREYRVPLQLPEWEELRGWWV